MKSLGVVRWRCTVVRGIPALEDFGVLLLAPISCAPPRAERKDLLGLFKACYEGAFGLRISTMVSTPVLYT